MPGSKIFPRWRSELKRSLRGAPRRSSAPVRRSRSELISFHAASWSQVLTLAVLIFGYFYTVVPAFQKERLEEQVAKLKEEKDAIVEEATIAKAELEMVNQKTAELLEDQKSLEKQSKKLQAEIAAKSKRIRSLVGRSTELENEAIELRAELKSTKAEVRKLRGQANSYAWQIFTDYFALQVRLPRLVNAAMMANAAGEDLDEISMRNALSMAAQQPYEAAMDVIKDIRASNKVPVEGMTPKEVRAFADRTERILEKNRNLLTCPAVNEDEWVAEFRKQSDHMEAEVEACVTKEWQNLIEERGWSDGYVSRLRQEKYWERQNKVFQEFCDLRIQYRLENRFREAIWDIKRACGRRNGSIHLLLMGVTFPP